MPDVTAARRTEALDFAGRERWEVVVVDVTLAGLDTEIVETLLFGRRAQRGNGEDLCLAAGKQATAVHAWQHTDVHADGADFVRLAAVHTHTTVEDGRAHRIVHHVFIDDVDGFLAAGQFFFGFAFGEVGHNGGVQGIGLLLAHGFVAVVQRFVETIAHPGADGLLE